jgi:hypothetical protein
MVALVWLHLTATVLADSGRHLNSMLYDMGAAKTGTFAVLADGNFRFFCISQNRIYDHKMDG